MKKYNKNSPLIYIHVPKCAGSSVKEQFRNWFGRNLMFNYYNEKKGKLPQKRNIKKTFSSGFKRNICIYGHFNMQRGFGIKDLYPEVNQFITIIRDPAELVISNYYYLKRVGAEWIDKSRIPDEDFEQYINNCEMNFINHFPSDFNKDNFKYYLEENFIYIGIVEDLEYSLSKIARLLDKSLPKKIHRINETKRPESHNYEMAKEILIQRFPFEFELYDYVKSSYK